MLVMVDKRVDYLGEGNPKWRGRDAKYPARHVRVRTARGKASEYLCAEGCGEAAFEWAHIHDTDPFDVENYRPLCVKCHRAYDDEFTLRGEKHPRVKLTNDQVREIRRRHANGEVLLKLAPEFGVTPGAISKICLRNLRKDVLLSLGGDA